MPIGVKVADVGEQGPRGAAGVGTGGVVAYEHIQSTPSAEWIITHDLGYRPNVTVEDSAGTVIEGGELTYVDTTQLIVRFGSAFGGRAFLS